ncbi:MAG: hypothetical protein AB1489_25505 [Acidobacteriota bacterium]
MGIRFLLIFLTGVIAIILCVSIIVSISAQEYEFTLSAALNLVFLLTGICGGYSLAWILTGSPNIKHHNKQETKQLFKYEED